jgi:hypothetical protein
MNKKIIIKNESAATIIINRIYELGFKIYSYATAEDVFKATKDGGCLPLSRWKSIELNSSHVAEVSKDGIRVGCQTFPLDVAQKLVDAVNKIKS